MRWYTSDPHYDFWLTVALAFAAFVAAAAWFVPSSYGRFSSPRFGLRLNPRLGWLLMELPASLVFLWVFWQSPRRTEVVPLILCGVFCVHYANRGFAFPLLMRIPRGQQGTFSLLIVGVGWFSTALHGYLNAAFIGRLGPHLTWDWLGDPRFIAGLALYAVSLGANIHSDGIIRNLRTRAEVDAGVKTYRIPTGGLFRWVTNASYLAELGAWAGWTLGTWSLAGVYILSLSAANLVPRALATHRWYQGRFPDYPSGRRILIPFVW